MGQIVVIGETNQGALSDASRELLAKAQEIADMGGDTVSVVVLGEDSRDSVKTALAKEAIVIVGPGVAAYHPETYERAIVHLLDEIQPSLVLMGNTTMGMDLGAAIAARREVPMVAYCTGLDMDGETLVATSQVYGGKLSSEIEVPKTGTVVTVIPGSWSQNQSSGSPDIRDLEAPQPNRLELVKVIEAEVGQDVDITKADILVSVGRGIEDPDNLELADQLAEALHGVVSCSRPVVDAGWLPRSRQVGKSGQTVKPKVYLALGISGAPEHLQGMKDAELIIAVNNDERAPIFEVAQYGATADMLDLMPALTEKLQERVG